VRDQIDDLDVPLRADRAAVDAALASFCAAFLPDIAKDVAEAIEYSLLGGGKRLRAILLLAAYRATGGTGDAAELAAAIEVVHAYSLIHDDLPCMDDDDVRRGRPTVHRAFGVSVATAAGLAMVPLAARCALRAVRRMDLSRDTQRQVLSELLSAAGAGGMIGGQLLDLEGEGESLSLAALERMHRCKTGMLITASVRLGGVAAGGTAADLDALSAYGTALGLAFQIADDVLDVTSTTDALGKTAGKDVRLNKSTYPSLLGVEGAMTRAHALAADACDAVRAAGVLTPDLEHLARYIVDRRS
jgi:geranylgeranyl pyrophosphate synthase